MGARRHAWLSSTALAVAFAIAHAIGAAACVGESPPEVANDASTQGDGDGVARDAGESATVDAHVHDADVAIDREAGARDADADAAVMSCTTFVDRTAPDASRELTWDFTFPTTPERCLLVRAGQTVTFGNGAGGVAVFAIHSVQASGGDVPSPIDALDLATGAVTFDQPGTFGFFCVDHRSMRGAIRAIP